MPFAQVSLSRHQHAVSIGFYLLAAMLCIWVMSTAFDQGRAHERTMSPTASVLVTMSLLDMSLLSPVEFGDWETSPPVR